MNLVCFRGFLRLMSCLLPGWNASTQRKLLHNASELEPLGMQPKHWFVLTGPSSDSKTEPCVQKR